MLASSSPKNNPKGVRDVSSDFQCHEFCEELGEDPTRFQAAAQAFQADVEALIEEANTKDGGMDIDDFKELMDSLRPAGHDRVRRGGGTSFEYAHRPAAVSSVYPHLPDHRT